MARALGWNSGSMISRWCGSDHPVIDGIIETKWGKIGGITLPYSEATLYDDQDGLLTNIVAALRLASRLGAKAVTMTGLIPSATELGHAVVKSIAASGVRGLPAISTGHATTSATVVLNISRALKACGREMAPESVAFVGLGSVGLSVLRLVLKALPHPREIILCDVYARAERLEGIQAELIATTQFNGAIRIATAKGMTPDAVYEASIIVGATNAADIIDINRLRPGTVIVDDSAPHCFPLMDAIARFEKEADILFTEGGVLSLPEQVREVAFHPAELTSPEDLKRYADYLSHDARSITGCVLSGLLTAKLGFPASLGQVGIEESVAHYNVLSELGFSGGRLHCDSYILPAKLVEKFRRSFGSS